MCGKAGGRQAPLYKAAVRADSGLPSATDTAMAKLSCNRAGYETADVPCSSSGPWDTTTTLSSATCSTGPEDRMIAGGTVEQMLNRIAAGFLPPDAEAAPRRDSMTKSAR